MEFLLDMLGLTGDAREELREWINRRVDAGMDAAEALKDHPMYWAPFPSLGYDLEFEDEDED